MVIKSRAVLKRHVTYEWHGEKIFDGECVPERRIADWFASRCANEMLGRDLLDPKFFNDYQELVSAATEDWLQRISRGRMRPGSEVQLLKSAHVDGVPMFEFRKEFDCKLLRKRGKNHIRHYVAEPEDRADVVFGLVIHLKDTSGDEAAIKEAQNAEIEKAIAFCEDGVRRGWTY